jgi:hypothetical protein
MRLNLGDKVRISDLTMTVTLIRIGFEGRRYTLAYFHDGNVKELNFYGSELDAWGFKKIGKDKKWEKGSNCLPPTG